ncbi:ABC transporter ATP-binding protein [Pararhodospirillum oryzae]|uniref:ABC transporter n=1 Tax=Pararhodospirillum oryzae TaxID=478448 RepID=A0A512HB34_9PROT|nr:ABC transporter [Pararhodospirillum oryzae]
MFQDLTLEAPLGAWTCLLGPSGVGKSTLLRLVAGLETGGTPGPNTRITDDTGQPLDGRCAYMGQGDGLLPWLDAVRNVALGPRLRGRPTPADRDRALALLAQVGLAAHAHDRPGTLSGGMRQRVALARTLMEDRPVVLMDEPFSALDPPTRLRLGDLAATLLAGRTVILVTHDPLEALRLGHHVHVLAGRPARPGDAIRPDGTPPRPPGSAAVQTWHAPLLTQLAKALDTDEER